jgi:hypothetical protein
MDIYLSKKHKYMVNDIKQRVCINENVSISNAENK